MIEPDERISKKGLIKISEIFGPTIQGEGNLIGRPTIFIRTFGCDSYCTVCDSMHAVDPNHPEAGKAKLMGLPEIIRRVNELDNNGNIPITLSGGNPLVWDLTKLVEMLKHDGREVWVETQGTMYKPWLVFCNEVTISPKGPGMNDTRRGLMTPDKLCSFLLKLRNGRQDSIGSQPVLHSVAIKIVVFSELDLNYAQMMYKGLLEHTIPPVEWYLSIGNSWVNERGGNASRKTLMRYDEISNLVLKKRSKDYDTILNNFTLLPQLHTLVWGNKKGV